MIPQCESRVKDFYCADQDENSNVLIECTGESLCCFWCKDLGTCTMPCLICKPYISEKTKERELATMKKTVGIIPCDEFGCEF